MTATEKYLVLDYRRDRISEIELWDNGIIFIKIDDGAEIGLEDSKRQLDFLKEKYDGINKFKVLVIPGRYSTLSKEAREFSTKPETNEMTLANAVVVQSLAHRIVLNFIISLTRQQNMKMRIFDDKNKAIDWLLSFEKNK
ncbi:hypothetical protein [Sediminibacterium sp.]|uniref:DUF7793 family protein n=1 Tax=Sediminibacterium sp. TaxID=1917865 RepID=UPI0027362F85|nr:hypothetical protein [Sediminibacterium sp.]MDP3567527.1 hypothetical protein [Sediminibacterium sp.]